MPTDHQATVPDSNGGGSEELRSSPRKQYPYRQKIAPINDDQMPSSEDFFEVECHNISGGGLSLYMDRAPEFENLVVALGRPPAVIHLTAQVVHVAPVDQEGATRYRVGCRFQQQVQL